MFTLKNWNPQRMAKVIRASGARFAGMTSEHHDGFAMWDSELSQWDAADMGPRRDVIGELAQAVRDKGMKFAISQHRINLVSLWPSGGWYSRGDSYDTRNPKYWGLYFPPMEGRRTDEWIQDWQNRLVEKVNKYRPDLMLMENGWDEKGPGSFRGPTYYRENKKAFLAEWFNKCLEWGINPVVTYKQECKYDYGVLNLEGGKMKHKQPFWWQTDMHLGGGWFYNKNASYIAVNRLVDDIVDRTSKRGITLLSFGAKADGTIAEPIKQRLRGLGQWFDTNGDAIYATRPWKVAQEGENLRFTRNKQGDTLYVICLDWPGEKLAIESLAADSELCPQDIERVRLLGHDGELEWSREGDALHVTMPSEQPCKHAYSLKVELKADK
jgi:alpha-L-fucosidase